MSRLIVFLLGLVEFLFATIVAADEIRLGKRLFLNGEEISVTLNLGQDTVVLPYAFVGIYTADASSEPSSTAAGTASTEVCGFQGCGSSPIESFTVRAPLRAGRYEFRFYDGHPNSSPTLLAIASFETLVGNDNSILNLEGGPQFLPRQEVLASIDPMGRYFGSSAFVAIHPVSENDPERTDHGALERLEICHWQGCSSQPDETFSMRAPSRVGNYELRLYDRHVNADPYLLAMQEFSVVCTPPAPSPQWIMGSWIAVFVDHRGGLAGWSMDFDAQGRVTLAREGEELRQAVVSEVGEENGVTLCLPQSPFRGESGSAELLLSDSASAIVKEGFLTGERSSTSGRAILTRFRPVVYSAEVLDSRPPWLDRAASDQASAMLVEAYGADTVDAFWLRIRGVALPTADGDRIKLELPDPHLTWTGESRIPFRIEDQMPEVLDLRVAMTEGFAPGQKLLRLNGSQASWSFGTGPGDLSFLEARGGPDSYRLVESLFAGNQFVIDAPVSPSLVGEEYVFLQLPGQSVEQVPLRPHETSSGLRLRSDPMQTEIEMATVAGAEAVIRQFAPAGQPSPALVRIPVVAPDNGIWARALSRARACRADGADVSVRNLIIFNGEIREIAITEEDHAAAIIIRDELIEQVNVWIVQNGVTLPGQNIGDPIRDDDRLAARTAAIRVRSAPFANHSSDTRVTAPTGETIPLAVALGARMEKHQFGGDADQFDNYAVKAIREARQATRDLMADYLADLRSADVCDFEDLLPQIRFGTGKVATVAASRLVRAATPGEPGPAWRADRGAQAAVTSFDVMVDTVNAQIEWSEVDSFSALAASSVLTGVASGAISGISAYGGRLAVAGGRLAAAGGRLGAAGSRIASLGGRVAQFGNAVRPAASALQYSSKAFGLLTTTETALIAKRYFDAIDRTALAETLSPALGQEIVEDARAYEDERFWDAMMAVSADLGLETLQRVVGPAVKYFWRNRKSAPARTDPSRLDEVAYREALVDSIADVADYRPRLRLVGGEPEEVSGALEGLGLDGDTVRRQIMQLGALGTPPDQAAARILRGNNVPPGRVLDELDMSPEEFARLLDLQMRREGISDPIRRAAQIREYMGADFTPPELYLAAETGTLVPDQWWRRDSSGPARRALIHTRQIDEGNRLRELEALGVPRAQAKEIARLETAPPVGVSGGTGPARPASREASTIDQPGTNDAFREAETLVEPEPPNLELDSAGASTLGQPSIGGAFREAETLAETVPGQFTELSSPGARPGPDDVTIAPPPPSINLDGARLGELAERMGRAGLDSDAAAIAVRRNAIAGRSLDEAAAVTLMRSHVDPEAAMREMDLSPIDMARLLNDHLEASGAKMADRGKEILSWMGADLAPVEVYSAALGNGGLHPGWSRNAALQADQIADYMEPDQIVERERIETRLDYGLELPEARSAARQIMAGGEVLQSLDLAVKHVPPRQLVENGVAEDVVAHYLDRRALRGGITDASARADYIEAAFGSGPLPDFVRLQRVATQAAQLAPEMTRLRSLQGYPLRPFAEASPAERQSVRASERQSVRASERH